MFSVITTDYVQDLDLVIFGGICYAATKEHKMYILLLSLLEKELCCWIPR